MPRPGRPHYDVYRDLAEALRRKARRLDLPCHVCLRPILWDAEWKHPLSYTYDHDVPLALGGNPRGPGKPAHRRCNSKRNARVAIPRAPRPRPSRAWGCPAPSPPPPPAHPA